MPQINVEELQRKMANQEPVSSALSGEILESEPNTNLPILAADCRLREEEAEERKKSGFLTPAFNPLLKLDPKRVNTRRDILEQLNALIPQNDYGLPIFIYRADLLHPQDFLCLSDTSDQEGFRLLQDRVNASMVTISYHQGFPVLPNGQPFWQCLDYEPQEAHQAFLAYLELGAARQLHALESWKMDVLLDFYHVYYWGPRIQAFELYRVAQHQRIKLHRVLTVENDQYEKATQLIQKLMSALTDEKLEEMSGTQVLRALDTLMKTQRTAVGLSANGGAEQGKEAPKATTMELILQQVSQGAQPEKVKKDEDIDLLMADPGAIEQAQKLILKMGMK